MVLVLLQAHTTFLFSGTFSHRKSLGLGSRLQKYLTAAFGPTPQVLFCDLNPIHPFPPFSVFSLIRGHHFGTFPQVGSGRHFSLCSGNTSDVSLVPRPAHCSLRHWPSYASGSKLLFSILFRLKALHPNLPVLFTLRMILGKRN